MATQWAKTKGPVLNSIKPKHRAGKSHEAVSQIIFEQHIAIDFLLKQMPTNSDLLAQVAKGGTVNRHARSDFCVTCRRTHVLD